MLKNKFPKKIKTDLKLGDNVLIISGKDKGKRGKILLIDRKLNKVLVEGLNIIVKHQKPSAKNHEGGIISKEAMIHASNVMYIHNDKPTRIGLKVETIEENGVKSIIKRRIAKSTVEVIY